MSKETNGIETIHVVSQTHWDREWYQDFQGFRARLVYMIDELIDHMEKDPEYKHFMMDGQTIVLDDYLEIRPENRERLQKLIQAGRIDIGPWYVMPDEFLVSGESLIRNIQKGMSQSRSWGVEPMMSGFVVDIFGHNSQMPQILQGFGIDNAVLFRGFHGDADPSEIWWEGADGSRVLGLKLDEDRSYSDFYFAFRWPFFDRDDAYEAHKEELIDRAVAHMAFKNRRTTTTVGIGMDGVDHVEIEPQLPLLIKLLNETDRLNVTFIHSSLEKYLEELRSKLGELRVYKGEQKALAYNGVNNWVPENTLSSRIHLKQHNYSCETLLEKWAEPLGVMTSLEGRPYSAGFLNKAWEHLLQNHPHDSICGCSIDQVHQDMIYRFDQSRLISEQMIKEQTSFIVDHLNESELGGNQAFTVFNSSSFGIEGVIEVELLLPAGSDAAVALKGMGGTSFRLFDHARNEVSYQVLSIRSGSANKFRPYRELPRLDMVDRYRIAFAASIPAMGYSTYTLEKYTIEHPAPLAYSAPKLIGPVRHTGSMQTDENTWNNGRIIVQVGASGTIDVTDIRSGHTCKGLLVFEDEGDIGDGWSHIAPVGNTKVRSSGLQAVISTVADGAYQSTIRVQLTLKLPKGIEAGENGRSSELVDVPVTTYIDLKKDDPVIYCRTSITNTARDHRLRLLFPAGLDAEHYYTSTPFDFVKRDVRVPDQSDYLRKPFEVVPHNGIVALDDGERGFALYSKGLYEVSVRDNAGRTIALTLYRSTHKEVLSDGSDGGQLLGQLDFEYAIRLFAAKKDSRAGLWKEHQLYSAGIKTINRKQGKQYRETPHRREADLPLRKSYLTLESEELILSAYKQADDGNGYVVRIFNIEDTDGEGVLGFDRPLLSVQRVNLDDRLLDELTVDGSTVKVNVMSKQIVTLKVNFA
ncbi:alpha-mannosidase [Paenibacillus spongiae]|uniref:Glycosyl hydrolase-related protein n=1 Tax=Paenibacillus spongiae TaxID=2909671 RepID=A0ABY5S5L2_9BACL|nr:glycoside hydrolase family 38 C-terminal domain-containing protein [Paenibacillus spongiae]UVI28865.1 glycosyl hydrolase-related protein [Paenibacillus spongiae]